MKTGKIFTIQRITKQGIPKTTFAIPDAFTKHLEAEARRRHKTPGELFNAIVQERLEELQDARDIKAALRAAKRITVPVTEVFSCNGLEG